MPVTLLTIILLTAAICLLGGVVAAMAWRARRTGRLLWQRLEATERKLGELEFRVAREDGLIWGAVAHTVSDVTGIRFAAQCGEDYTIWRSLSFARRGFFVDIGAYDGVTLSNTYALEEIGWTGLCVEAGPAAYEQCRANRPRSMVLHAAVGGCGASGSVRFRVTSGGPGDAMLSHMLLASRDALEPGRPDPMATDHDVRFVSLQSVFEMHVPAGQEVSVLSIDIEGAELEALRGLDWHRYRPRVVVAEANDPNLLPFMEANGYCVLARSACNWLFADRAQQTAVLT